MKVKEVFLGKLRHRMLAHLYDMLWRTLDKRGSLQRIAIVVSETTAKWILVQVDAPRSIVGVNGVQVSICAAKIDNPINWYFSPGAVVLVVDYYVPKRISAVLRS